jgi:hypothetical protein
VPKHRNTTTHPRYCHFGVLAIGFSRYARTGGLAPRFPESRNSKTPNSKYTILFWDFASQDFETCECKGTRPWVFRVPKQRKAESIRAKQFREFANGFSGYATIGGLAPGFPGSRNSEIPNSKHAPLFRGFPHRDFVGRVFETGEYLGPALRYPGCRNTEVY